MSITKNSWKHVCIRFSDKQEIFSTIFTCDFFMLIVLDGETAESVWSIDLC